MTRFPPFRLDTLNHCLWREEASGKSEPVGLAPKTFDVLRYLAESGGRLVRHDELLDALWQDGDVQPEVLKGHILAIRTALGDDAQHPQFIETHRGRGYRFIADTGNGALPGSTPPNQGGMAPFVGRETEIEALRTAFEAAWSGRPGMVFVSGEPGMGKTALIERFVNQIVNGSPVRVAVGRSIESHGTGEPYFPVFEALSNLIKNDIQDGGINALLGNAPSWALQLPGLMSAERWAALQRQIGDVPRDRLVGEFCDFVEALTADRPMLLVLEDLHWADFSTIDLLKSVASRKSRAKLLVVGTYRKEIASYRKHPVGELVQNLLPYDMCSELCLPPLSNGEVGTLMATENTAEQVEFSDFVARRAGGNPLFVSLILDHLIQKKQVEKLDATWRLLMPVRDMAFDAHATLANVVELQIAKLNADQQALLECASIFGDGFEAAAVASLEQQDETAIERKLETLSRSSLFIARGEIEYPEDGLPFRRYLFKHAAYRSAFYERQAPTQRARRHLAAASILGEAGADPVSLASELARHFEAAASWAQALEQLQRLLAVAKKRFAHRDAIAIIERAESVILRLRGDKRDRQELAWLEEKAAIQAANHDSAARETYEALVQRAAAQYSIDVQVRALLGLAFVQSWFDAASCLATLERTLQVGKRQTDAFESARTRISCHVWKIWVGGWDRDAANECEQLIGQIRESDDQAPAAWSMVEYSMLCLLSSRYGEAQDTVNRSFAVLLQTQHDRPDSGSARATWMVSLGVPWADMLLGELGRSVERFEANIDMLEKNASPYAANMLRLVRAQLYIHALDFNTVLDECKVVMRSVEDRMRGGDAGSIATLPGERRTCEIMLGVAHAGLGNLKNAIRQLLQVEREILAQPINFDWYRLLFLEWALSSAYLMQGDLDNAWRRAAKFLERAQATDEMCWHALAWETASRVAIHREEHDLAAESIARAVDIVELNQVPLVAWRVYRTAATIHANAGDTAQSDGFNERFMRERQRLVESLPQEHRLRGKLEKLRLNLD